MKKNIKKLVGAGMAMTMVCLAASAGFADQAITFQGTIKEENLTSKVSLPTTGSFLITPMKESQIVTDIMYFENKGAKKNNDSAIEISPAGYNVTTNDSTIKLASKATDYSDGKSKKTELSIEMQIGAAIAASEKVGIEEEAEETSGEAVAEVASEETSGEAGGSEDAPDDGALAASEAYKKFAAQFASPAVEEHLGKLSKSAYKASDSKSYTAIKKAKTSSVILAIPEKTTDKSVAPFRLTGAVNMANDVKWKAGKTVTVVPVFRLERSGGSEDSGSSTEES